MNIVYLNVYFDRDPDFYVLKHMIENREATGRNKAAGLKRLLAPTKEKMILLYSSLKRCLVLEKKI